MSDLSRSGPRVVSTFALPGKIRLAALPPLALYVHFPWCVRKLSLIHI